MLLENDSIAPGMTGVQIPFRGNLVRDCIRVIQMRIANGEWLHVVPGERRLAEQAAWSAAGVNLVDDRLAVTP